jgi:hypothetical protein
MASPAQIITNRDNAQHSTGPRTAEGKQASSRNSTRHGLTGSQIVIPGEDPIAYEDMRQDLHRSHRPGNETERILVDQIAANAWRLARAQRIETAYLRKITEDAIDPEAAIATAFIEKPAELMKIARYVSAANSAFYKAQSQLEKMQKARAAAELEAAMMESLCPPREQSIGFVSQPGIEHIGNNFQPSENGPARGQRPAEEYLSEQFVTRM